MEYLKEKIRDIPDFPKKGIIFKDITPLLLDPKSFKDVINIFKERYIKRPIDKIVAIESRGFIFGGALAMELEVGLAIVRKPGKLPYRVIKETYELEYGTDSIEIHEDAIRSGERVLILDDLLATGGTVHACTRLVEKLGGKVEECAFVIELSFLNGREKLKNYSVFSIIKYFHN